MAVGREEVRCRTREIRHMNIANELLKLHGDLRLARQDATATRLYHLAKKVITLQEAAHKVCRSAPASPAINKLQDALVAE